MSNEVDLTPTQVDDAEVDDEWWQFDRRRLAAGTAGVALLVLVDILLLRSSRRAVLLAEDIQEVAPQVFVALAIVVALGALIAPVGLTEALKRASRNPLTGPALVAGAIGLGITPALVSWLNAGWEYSKIAGVLPWSDANAYYIGGEQLLDTGELDAFNSRRPLNAGFYAVRMALTGHSYWAIILIQGALVGLAGYLVVRVVTGRLGVAAGLVIAGILYAFVRPLVDLNLSESLGLALGCLAVAALWQGVANKQPKLFALGLLVLTVALNVRAGAYFVLPALLVWVTVDNLHARRLAWRPVALAVAAVVGGFVLNLPMNTLYGTGAGSINGNFSYTLYGLAHGGTGWASAYEEFDPSDYSSEAALADAVYQGAFDQIRDHPGDLMRGIGNAYDTYFDEGIYGFAPSPIAGGLLLVMIIGLVALVWRGPNRRLGSMVLAAWCGILLSVPFIFEDGGFRVMAATMPFLALPPAAGVALIARGGFRRWSEMPDPPFDDVHKRRAALIAASCIAAISVLAIGPLVAVALHDSPSVPDVECARDQTRVVAEVGPQTAHITILAQGVEPRNFGEMTYEQFHSDPTYAKIEMRNAFAEIEAGSVVFAVRNFVPGASPRESAFVVAPASEMPHTRRLVAFCGRPSSDAKGSTYGMVFTDSFEVPD